MKNETKQTAKCVVDGERISITLRLTIQDLRSGERTVDLKPVTQKIQRLSLTGDCPNSSGQCDSSIREIASDVPEIQEICDIWDRWHLNDMKAGTSKQMEALKGLEGEHTHEKVVAFLKGKHLYTDRGYAYGSAWLSEPVPARVIKRVKELLTAINGKRFGAAPDISDAPEIDENADTLDSRDVIKALEIYRDAVTALGLDPDAKDIDDSDLDSDGLEIWETYIALRNFDEECSGYASDWQHGETLINDSYFEDYARELAKDIGAVKLDSKWPNNHIDWEAAAEELQRDYTSIKFKGQTFWIR